MSTRLLALFFCFLAAAGTLAAAPVPVKVVVITFFEPGGDQGDAPGEYQYWVERQHLDTILPFPQGYHDLRLNPKTGVLGILTNSTRSSETYC